jgi:hypothetical protein
MKLHQARNILLAAAALLALPAAALQAGQIRSADAIGSYHAPSSVESSPAIAQATEVSLGEFALEAVEPTSLLAPMATATLELPADSTLIEKSEVANVNLTPIGIMVATSAVTVVPEPSAIILLGCGAVGIFLAARRRRV